MSGATDDTELVMGGLVFPNMDQCDFTGPFEVLARIPGSRFHIIWKNKAPVADMKGLRLLPDTTFSQAPQLDVLLVPGGYGQEDLMNDDEVLSFIRKQAISAKLVYSVCTGALLCGAAGLLHGKRATTHWSAIDSLEYFGATPSHDRVVVDGNLVTAAGVTAGIDGALIVASLLRGEEVAQELQLYMAYDPQPPFDAGSPFTAPQKVVSTVRQRAQGITMRRINTAKAYQGRMLHRVRP